MPLTPAPRLLRASEVAAMLGTSKLRVLELIASGQLRSVRLGANGGGWHRIPVEAVEALIQGEPR